MADVINLECGSCACSSEGEAKKRWRNLLTTPGSYMIKLRSISSDEHFPPYTVLRVSHNCCSEHVYFEGWENQYRISFFINRPEYYRIMSAEEYDIEYRMHNKTENTNRYYKTQKLMNRIVYRINKIF